MRIWCRVIAATAVLGATLAAGAAPLPAAGAATVPAATAGAATAGAATAGAATAGAATAGAATAGAAIAQSATAGAATAPGPYPGAVPFRPDGALTSAPATVFGPSFGQAAFVTGSDGGVWWSTRSRSWSSLGAPPAGVQGDPAAVSWADGRIDVFVRGGDNRLWQRWTACGGCSWSPWLKPVGDRGVLASSPTATSWSPGRIDIFVLGIDGGLWQIFWAANTWNGAWLPRGAPRAGLPAGVHPAAASWGPGRIDLFAQGADHRLWQTVWAGAGWSGWFEPPGTEQGVLASAPAASPWGRGLLDPRPRLTVWTTGTDARLYQTTWDGGWSAWSAVGAPTDHILGAPGAPTTLQGETYALGRGTDNRCYGFFPSQPLGAGVAGAAAWAASRAGVAGFTVVDTLTDQIWSGGAATAPIRTASVIKVPIAMDLVATANAEHRGLTATEQANLRLMITQSDNNAASALWNEDGGANVIHLMDALGATSTAADPGGAWGFTLTTSRDLAVVLAQLAQGVLGPGGTNLILSLMRQVIPSQAWGIGAAIPGAAIKNGWFPDPSDWRVNCLGIASAGRYAIAVMTQYPIALGQGYGEITCQGVAARLLPHAGPAPFLPAPPATEIPALSGIGMTVDGG